MKRSGNEKTMKQDPTAETLIHWIRHNAVQQPGGVALLAPGRAALTYRRLAETLETGAARLADLGVQRSDRVAVVLPNGPELASAFLTVISAATCAPLNPAYTVQEFEFYLADLKAKFLVVASGSDSPAVSAARSLRIPVIELRTEGGSEAGVFSLLGTGTPRAFSGSLPQADDLALVLHTSGTTSRPKIVPLNHANLIVSARNIAAGLDLAPDDRCLNIMPLFHVHGLVGAVCSSLVAAASVVCTPGLEPEKILGWMAEFLPSWFTAVPTMHQAILECVEGQSEVLRRLRLRFIRSCSSSLSPQIGQRLEEIFRAPVIEAYGMTEATHQIASNPLPPRPHKFGSVGLPTGDEVAILDENGNSLPPKTVGEISIRGANITRGYEENPSANVGAFSHGWLRTGDRGYRDEEGYIYIQGRLKEMINRGGEKITPREIDEILLQHPAVSQAVTFALPHPTLGEEVAAAIILREGQNVESREIRQFVASRLSDFKVPRKVIFVREIPKGPTGKIQRIGLADKLKDDLEASDREPRAYLAPRTPLESVLVHIWQEVLTIPRVGVEDDYLELGGDSLLATQVLARIKDKTGQELTLSDLFAASTIAGLADRIEKSAS
jgi:acyl-CoA synthetase (AMP-forming)/AMP-acid ligase II/acyl carrier protein